MCSLRGIIQHPYFDLAGVRVYADAKVGKDAGELADLPSTGIRATNRIEDILAARPDCLMYFPATDNTNIDDVCRVLESGINIVTLLSEFYYLPELDADVRRRLEAACARGGTSLYATGPSPGFVTGPLALGAISFQRRFDRLRIWEFANLGARRSPEMNSWLFGWRPGEKDVSKFTEMMRRYSGEALWQTSAAIGLPFDRTTAVLNLALATEDFDIFTMPIKKGAVAAWLFEVTGWRNEAPLMQIKTLWTATATHLDQPWEVRDTDGWRMSVEGDTPLDISVHFEKDYGGGDSSRYNAHICLNAVPAVCEARPGVLTTADLPPIVAQFAEAGA
jgi:4-hydroxy-tetrahydrodipicolinate reductase